MLSHVSESRDPNYDGSAVCPKYSRKDCLGRSCWLYPRENCPEVVQGPGGATTSRPVATFKGLGGNSF